MSKEYPPAGRELDRIVADRLMGLRPRSFTVLEGTPHARMYWRLEDRDGDSVVGRCDTDANISTSLDDVWEDCCPNYSTEIAAAWEVRDEIKRRWDGLVIRDEPGVLEVSVIRHPRSYFDCDIPAAICLAALRALDAAEGGGG